MCVLPAAVALCVIPNALVSVLFQRGAFGVDDAASTALAVAVYGLGLPAFVMQKVLQPLYFAREDTTRPFYFALAAMVVNAGLAIGLAPMIGFIAAAIATTLAGWVMLALLWWFSRGYGEAGRFDGAFSRRWPRILLASVAMGALLWAVQIPLGPFLATPGLRYGALAVLVTLGGVSYFGFAHLFGAIRLSDLRGAMRR